MKLNRISSLLLSVALLTSAGLSHAQSKAASREQVSMDAVSFLAMHRWDEGTGMWVLKSGMVMPAGVKSREEVIAMRDQFLSMNRWNEGQGLWEPVQGGPRMMSSLGREQVEMETTRFLMMHRYDTRTNEWVRK